MINAPRQYLETGYGNIYGIQFSSPETTTDTEAIPHMRNDFCMLSVYHPMKHLQTSGRAKEIPCGKYERFVF
jgi:DNA gyrase inhibitor GyrI